MSELGEALKQLDDAAARVREAVEATLTGVTQPAKEAIDELHEGEADYVDGTPEAATADVTNPDGSVTHSDGTVTRTDGVTVRPDGSVVA